MIKKTSKHKDILSQKKTWRANWMYKFTVKREWYKISKSYKELYFHMNDDAFNPCGFRFHRINLKDFCKFYF